MMKKVLSVFLSVLMFFSACAVGASAATTGDSGEFSALCLNVAGLPSIDYITGGEDKNVLANQADIGRFVEAGGFDIFATQEDFGYHEYLVKQLKSYNYATQHHGGVPYGDGTNVFTKGHKMYNEKHIPWNTLAGLVDEGADQFSQKGITYVCIEIADGVLVDFYDIHADANGGEASVNARRDNFTQLAELINNREVDRPVIVTGDFNAFLFNDSSNLKSILVDGCGLKDAWVELKNNGDYNDCSSFVESMGGNWEQKWGKWDAVERFMYKDGSTVKLDCTSFEYVTVLNRKGVNASDHVAAAAKFSYTVTGETGEQGALDGSHGASGFEEFIRKVVSFFKAIMLVFKNFDQIKEELKNYFGK